MPNHDLPGRLVVDRMPGRVCLVMETLIHAEYGTIPKAGEHRLAVIGEIQYASAFMKPVGTIRPIVKRKAGNTARPRRCHQTTTVHGS